MIGHYDRKKFADAHIIVGFDTATGAEVWIQDDGQLSQQHQFKRTAEIYRVPISGDNADAELLALVRQEKCLGIPSREGDRAGGRGGGRRKPSKERR
jgi:hypothetical protein